MWSFKGMCREAMLLVNTMGHVDVYYFYGVDIGGECQDDYDWKIKRYWWRQSLEKMKTFIHRILYKQ
jgi:hypothetical protein